MEANLPDVQVKEDRRTKEYGLIIERPTRWYLSRCCERLRIECGSGVTACYNAARKPDQLSDSHKPIKCRV